MACSPKSPWLRQGGGSRAPAAAAVRRNAPWISAVWAIMSVSTAAGVLTSALQGHLPQGRSHHPPRSTNRCPSEQQRRGRRIRLVAWAVALAVLVGALWYFNRPEPATPAPETPVTTAPVEDDTPVGYEVGMRAPDFSVPVYGADGSVFTLSEHRGKPVIVNFWATWCTPCCGELPSLTKYTAPTATTRQWWPSIPTW